MFEDLFEESFDDLDDELEEAEASDYVEPSNWEEIAGSGVFISMMGLFGAGNLGFEEVGVEIDSTDEI